jgi:maleylacetoacetate isomerase
LSIINYLNETRNAGFLPQSVPDRARVRAIADAIAMEIHPVCNPSVVAKAIKDSPDKEAARIAWMQHFIRKGLVGVECLLGDGKTGTFCHGDVIGLADICLIPQLYNAHRWNVDLSDLDKISGIASAIKGIPAFVAAYPNQ